MNTKQLEAFKILTDTILHIHLIMNNNLKLNALMRDPQNIMTLLNTAMMELSKIELEQAKISDAEIKSFDRREGELDNDFLHRMIQHDFTHMSLDNENTDDDDIIPNVPRFEYQALIDQCVTAMAALVPLSPADEDNE